MITLLRKLGYGNLRRQQHSNTKETINMDTSNDIPTQNTKEGIKYDQGKPLYHLIPPEVLEDVAKVFTYGATKYTQDNWKNIDDHNRLLSAAYRHLVEFQKGIDNDKESKLSHLSHVITNLMMISYLKYYKVDNTKWGTACVPHDEYLKVILARTSFSGDKE